jgi:hypothetical protein
MHTYNTYEKAPRQSPRYTGLFAIICLFASMLLAWAVMRTSLVKTGVCTENLIRVDNVTEPLKLS